MADKKSKKQLNVKKFKYKQIQQTWTPELVNINNQLNHWYSLWLISDKKDIQANLSYKFYKSQFKLVQRILIEKNNNEKILNFGDIYKKR